MQTPKQHDVFRLKKDINPTVVRGMDGVILEVWDNNKFEVEFVKDDGTNYEHESQFTFTVDSSYLEDFAFTTDFFPQLEKTISEHLRSALHEIGFTGWEHMHTEKRDGKVRLRWTCPVEGYNDWFLVLLVLESGQLNIDLLGNPLGQMFDTNDIEGLIAYINKFIRKVTDAANTSFVK